MEVPRHWRLQKQRYSLTGEMCPHCDTPIFPPRPICVACGDMVHPLENTAIKSYVLDKEMTASEPLVDEHREVVVESSKGMIFQSVSTTG